MIPLLEVQAFDVQVMTKNTAANKILRRLNLRKLPRLKIEYFYRAIRNYLAAMV